MRGLISGLVLAATAAVSLAPAAMAQTPPEQARWDAAKARFDGEFRRYYDERDRFEQAVRNSRRPVGYGQPPRGGYADPYATDYDATRYYREDPRYQERVLAQDDQVYRGSDGRAYCKRSDGTTGLIIGGAAGGLFGNVVDGGRNRTAGTLLGAAVGALIGRSAEQSNQQLRCR